MPKEWNWKRKADLIKRAKKGEDVFMELASEDISWQEFREWWQKFHELGAKGLRIRRGHLIKT